MTSILQKGYTIETSFREPSSIHTAEVRDNGITLPNSLSRPKALSQSLSLLEHDHALFLPKALTHTLSHFIKHYHTLSLSS